MRSAILLLLTLLCMAPAVRAAESESDGRWLPSFAATLALAGHNTSSSVASSLRPVPPPPPNGGVTTAGFGETFLREQTLLYPSVSGSFEIMSPVLIDMVGRPRIFAHADLIPILSPELKLASEGAADTFEVPENPSAPEEAIGGQGSRTSWDPATVSYGAGLGVSMSFEIWGLQVAVKPSAEWYQFQGTFRGFVSRALKRQGQLTIDRLVQIRAVERRTLNAVGGGLEAEVEIWRTNQFQTLMFAQARGYSIVGDRSIESSVFLPASPNPDRARFRFKTSPYLYNFGFGFRLRWLGM